MNDAALEGKRKHGEPQKEVVASSASDLPFVFDNELHKLLGIAQTVLFQEKQDNSPSADPATATKEEDEKLKPDAEPENGIPSFVFLKGTDGAGKTAILEEFAKKAPGTKQLLRCYHGGTKPFDIFEQCVSSLKKTCPQFNSLLENYGWGLKPVFSQVPSKDMRGKARRETFFAALSSVLIGAARETPLLLIVEDIDRLEPSVLGFLGFLGRSLHQRLTLNEVRANNGSMTAGSKNSPPRLLVVASCRPPKAGNDPASETLEGLQKEPYSLTIEAPDLTRRQFQKLLSKTPFEKVNNGAVSSLHRIVQGNPLRTSMLLRLFSNEAVDSNVDLVSHAERLNEKGILQAYMESLSSGLRNIAAVLALFRHPVSEELLARVFHMNVNSLKTTLAEGQAEGVLRKSGAGWFLSNVQFAWRAQQLLTPSEQQEWHDRIAETLTAGKKKLTQDRQYAYFQHAVRGTNPKAAVKSGLKASEFLNKKFAYQQSLVVLYNLLGMVRRDEESPPIELKNIMLRIIALEERIGRMNAAKQNLKNLLSDRWPGKLDRKARTELLIRLSRIYQHAGRFSKALRQLHRAPAKKLNDASVAQLCGAIASVRLDRRETKKALNYSLRAIAHTKGEKDHGLRADLRRLLSRIYRRRGNHALAVDSLLQALENAERSGGEKDSCPILDELGQLYLERGNYFRAARYLYRSLEAKQETYDLTGLACSYMALGEVYSRSGNFSKAIEEQCKAAEIYKLLGDWQNLGRNLIQQGHTYRRLGHIRESIKHLRSAVTLGEKSRNTEDLVSAFTSLAQTYMFLGDTKQAEAHLRQVQILAQEYELRYFEARSEHLGARISLTRRKWDEAAGKLSKALSVYAELGRREAEIDTELDLAYVYYDREMYSDALKAVGKAQARVEEVRDPFLQARTMLIKGNIYRFLHGGNGAKWRECLTQALDIARSVGDVNLHFEILYSLGKAHHDDHSFQEAENWYRKAEEILYRLAGELSEEEASRFWADKRRRLFREDYDRLKQESGPRPSFLPSPDTKKTNSGLDESSAVVEDLLAKIARLNSSVTHENFFPQVLGLGIDLLRANRGFLVETINGSWRYVAFRGLRPEALTGRMKYVETLISETVRRRSIYATSGREEEEKYGSRATLSELRSREAVLVPIAGGSEILGVLYADRTGGKDSAAWSEEIVNQFAYHAAVAWENRRTFLSATTWPGTSFLVEPYFLQVLKEALEHEERGGKPLALLGVRLPLPLGEISEKQAKDIRYVLGRERHIGVLGDNILVALLNDDPTPKELESSAQSFLARLKKILPIRGYKFLERRHPSENVLKWLQTLKYELNPSNGLIEEIQDAANTSLTLRDSKQLLEKQVIVKSLRRSGGNVTRAAKKLGVHRPQLSQLLRKHELSREAFDEGNGQ